MVNWLQVPKLQKVFMFTFSFKELKPNASKPVKLPCLPVVSSPANRDSIYNILILANNIYLIFLSGSSIYIMLGVFRKYDFSSKLARSIWTVSQCKLPIIVRSSNCVILMLNSIAKSCWCTIPCGIVISLNLVLLSSWFKGRHFHLTWGAFPVGRRFPPTFISNANPFRNAFFVISVLL